MRQLFCATKLNLNGVGSRDKNLAVQDFCLSQIINKYRPSGFK